ncbi:MAG: alkaline phosphatase family protein [Deltaproteobacteria bacterium]|nr:alkaline phosphatase family protein [Deltaproteobacteria bacterium]
MRDETSPAGNRTRPLGTLAVALLASAAGVGWTRWCWRSANAPQPELLAALKARRSPTPASATPPSRVLVVVIDGLGYDPAGVVDLGGGRCWTARVDMGTPTLSRPDYHVILTGIPQRAAGIMNNAHQGVARADTLAARVRSQGGRVAWALNGVTWFHDLAGAPRDRLHFSESARAAAEDLLRGWREGASFGVLHLMAVDDAGHERGGASPEYADAARRMASVVRDLRARLTDDTLVFVGADHGHLPRGGHGGPEPAVRFTRWQAFHPRCSGRRPRDSGTIPAVDLAPTLARSLGVSAPALHLGTARAVEGGSDRRDPGAALREEAYASTLRSLRRRRALLAVGSGLAVLALAVQLGLRGARRSRVLRAALVPAGAVLGWVLWVPRPLSLSTMGSQNQFVRESLRGMVLGATLLALLSLRREDSPRGALLAAVAGWAAVAAATGGGLGGLHPTEAELVWVPAMGFLPVAVTMALAVERLWCHLRARYTR